MCYYLTLRVPIESSSFYYVECNSLISPFVDSELNPTTLIRLVCVCTSCLYADFDALLYS